MIWRIGVGSSVAAGPLLHVADGKAHAQVVATALREGQPVTDRELDALYPQRVRELSAAHWTPIEVARRATKLLVVDASTRVLDVGSGAGKLCVVGALTTPAKFTGVENRLAFVRVARRTAKLLGAKRATFVHGDMRKVDWWRFDAFYFFNPFEENLFDASERLDDSPELSPERHERDVPFATSALERARVGARVVTYHGLGTDLPPGYECASSEPAGTDALELWVKIRG